MSKVAIKVENLSKLYRLGEVGTGSLAHDVNRWWHRIRGKEDPYSQVGQVNDRTKKSQSDWVWALKDINFEVEKGEALGIIGRNGAGKSTLLKILSRVTAPTTGQARAKGRIAALLEVGTGFHPELTGRDNIYLNGTILGMRKKEIDGKLEEIVDFSGCEGYLDTPVKRYSSGMQVRLAFAVAANLDPEILIVDEVLAVGDAAFQKKCMGKMNQVAEKEGRTILFVSHNLQAIRTLCPKALLLENGQMSQWGETCQVLATYLDGVSHDKSVVEWNTADMAPGDEVLRLRAVRIASTGGRQGYVTIEDASRLEIEYEVLRAHESVCVSFHLFHQDVCAFVGGTPSSPHSSGIHRATANIPDSLLNSGVHSVTIYLITNVTEHRVIEREVIVFNAEERGARGEYLGHIIGAVRPRLEWTLESLTSGIEPTA